MIPTWEGSTAIEYCRYHDDITYIAALFPDRVCIYDENTLQVLCWVIGTFVSMTFRRDYIVVIDNLGQDSYTLIHGKGGEITTTTTSSFATSLNLTMYTVDNLERVGSTYSLVYTFRYNSNLSSKIYSLYSDIYYHGSQNEVTY